MKRILLISVILLLFTLSGCNQAPDVQEGTIDKGASPVADFQYHENSEGTISIDKYIGAEQNVIIPAKIENKSVTRLFNAFQYNHTVVSVEIPDSVTEIGDSAFSGCHSLTSVSLPEGLKVINSRVFENCTKLSEISFPDSLTTIGAYAFKNCASLKQVKISKILTTIAEGAFLNSGIETIDFEEGIQYILTDVFAATNIKTVVLPKSVRKIEMNAFTSCTNLESITLNEGLVEIKSSAFNNLPKLTEIIIPASVTQISELAFDGCANLQAVKFEGNAPEKYRYKGPIHIDCGEYTVYYHKDALGFTSPQWYKHPTEIW